MKPSKIHARMLEDHEALREDVDRLEVLLARIRSDGTTGSVPALRRHAELLLEKLRVHMRWEELYLVPVLRVSYASGRERAEHILRDHREQEILVDFVLARLLDRRRPDALVSSDVCGLIAFLREDMDLEEAALEDEPILREGATLPRAPSSEADRTLRG